MQEEERCRAQIERDALAVFWKEQTRRRHELREQEAKANSVGVLSEETAARARIMAEQRKQWFQVSKKDTMLRGEK